MQSSVVEDRGEDLEKGKAKGAPAKTSPDYRSSMQAGCYLLANVVSATCIIFANKMLFSVLRYRFVYFVTLLHVLTTMLGLHCFALAGMFQKKHLPVWPLLALSIAFVGYIVMWNLSLQVNSVGFYQLSKIMILPSALVVQSVKARTWPSKSEVAAIFLLCMGVAQATISDTQMSTNIVGLVLAAAAVCFTVTYQTLAGSKQKELGVASMTLMAAYCPIASLMLASLVPVLEPLGALSQPSSETLLGFPYSPLVLGVIALTAFLGLAVSLSTFLALGKVSSVAFNVVGHTKTVIVLVGGCLLFGEEMPVARLTGICCALVGMIWFSFLKLKMVFLLSNALEKRSEKGI